MNKKILLILSAVALLLLAVFLWQRMSFSKEVLKLEILGPDKAALGEELEYMVQVQEQRFHQAGEPRVFSLSFPRGLYSKEKAGLKE